jgi:glucan phosphorylase
VNAAQRVLNSAADELRANHPICWADELADHLEEVALDWDTAVTTIHKNSLYVRHARLIRIADAITAGCPHR